MKASELRIGNWVTENDDTITNVSCWEFEKARLENNEKEMSWLQPIQLTEEWLLKFGFEFKENYMAFVKTINKDDEFIIGENVNKKEDYYLCDIDISVELKYAHQLQNLYFALTGKELTI